MFPDDPAEGFGNDLSQGSEVEIGRDLLVASATPLVLSILSRGESNDCAIIKRVDELSGRRHLGVRGTNHRVVLVPAATAIRVPSLFGMKIGDGSAAARSSVP